jgi:hypothetical protein
MPIDQEEMNRLNRMTERSWHPRPIDAFGVLFRAEFRGEEILPGYDFAALMCESACPARNNLSCKEL